MDWDGWLKEHRSNFYFWLLGSGSGSVTGAIGHAIANSLHGHPTDWALFSLFVLFGVTLAVIAYRLRPKLIVEHQVLDMTGEKTDQARVADQLAADEDARRRERTQYESDLYRALQSYEMEWEARNAAELKAEAAESRMSIFTPLQIEAFQLATEFGHLLSALPLVSEPSKADFAHSAKGVSEYLKAMDTAFEPRESAFEKIRAKYSHTLGGRLKDVVLRLRMEGCQSAPWLDNYFDDVPNELYLKPVQDELVAMAHRLDGVYLNATTYPGKP